MSDIIIRKATIEDFEELVGLRLELLKYEHSLNSKNKFNDARIEKSKELVRAYLNASNSVYFIAEVIGSKPIITGNEAGNKTVIAYIHGTKDKNPGELEGYSQGMCVLDSYRGQGIGERLHKELMIWYDGAKHGLTTDKNNILSINFHKKHGYKIINKDEKSKGKHSKSSDVVFMVSE